MTDRTYLGELEQTVLWAVLRLEEGAYGTRILDEIEERTDRRVSPGALYATLDRLETKGVIASRLADPEPGRGGRPKRFVTVTVKGREDLAAARAEWTRLWEGLDPSAALGRTGGGDS